MLTDSYRCECDYESHNYTYSFEPKADYSRVYASSTEIHGYFQDFAEKHNLYQYCKFGHRVVSADWEENAGVWKIAAENHDAVTIEAKCDILINATGILSSCKWPNLPGLDQFRGVPMHSGAWDQSIDVSGKKVCIIGNGYVEPRKYDISAKPSRVLAGHSAPFVHTSLALDLHSD